MYLDAFFATACYYLKYCLDLMGVLKLVHDFQKSFGGGEYNKNNVHIEIIDFL